MRAYAKSCDFFARQLPDLGEADPTPNQGLVLERRFSAPKADSYGTSAGYNQPRRQAQFLFLRLFRHVLRALDNALPWRKIEKGF